MIELHNADCMDYMRGLEDNAFDLAIVDPPYGIDAANTFSGEKRKSGQGASYKTAFAAKDWDKGIPDKTYFIELRLHKYTWNGMIQGDMKNKELRIHPTQKPVKLYEWLLKNYAKEGDRILDTHLGSGSSAIAAHYSGFDFVGCELDEDYFNAAQKRFDSETRQVAMF